MSKSNFGRTETVEIEGWEELILNLNALADLRVEILVAATLEGAKPVLDEANRLAPGPDIKVKVEVDKGGKVATARIGPDEEHWFYRFFETGVTPHEINALQSKKKNPKGFLAFEGEKGLIFTKVVKNAGGVAAKPFLRPALDHQKDAVVARVRAALWAAIREVISHG